MANADRIALCALNCDGTAEFKRHAFGSETIPKRPEPIRSVRQLDHPEAAICRCPLFVLFLTCARFVSAQVKKSPGAVRSFT